VVHTRNVTQCPHGHINRKADSSCRKIGKPAELKIIVTADDAEGFLSYARPRENLVPRRKVAHVLNPSRPLVISLVLVALVGFLLGLATDVGLFGWSFALLLAVYLGAAGIARLGRRRSHSVRKPA
jgi:hypothetical protein